MMPLKSIKSELEIADIIPAPPPLTEEEEEGEERPITEEEIFPNTEESTYFTWTGQAMKDALANYLLRTRI